MLCRHQTVFFCLPEAVKGLCIAVDTHPNRDKVHVIEIIGWLTSIHSMPVCVRLKVKRHLCHVWKLVYVTEKNGLGIAVFQRTN